jgi:hypothetical protein
LSNWCLSHFKQQSFSYIFAVTFIVRDTGLPTNISELTVHIQKRTSSTKSENHYLKESFLYLVPTDACVSGLDILYCSIVYFGSRLDTHSSIVYFGSRLDTHSSIVYFGSHLDTLSVRHIKTCRHLQIYGFWLPLWYLQTRHTVGRGWVVTGQCILSAGAIFLN